jgi:hypothetical protein
MVESGLRETT